MCIYIYIHNTHTHFAGTRRPYHGAGVACVHTHTHTHTLQALEGHIMALELVERERTQLIAKLSRTEVQAKEAQASAASEKVGGYACMNT